MTWIGRMKVEERSISGQGHSEGKLLDGTEFQILFDTGASK